MRNEEQPPRLQVVGAVHTLNPGIFCGSIFVPFGAVPNETKIVERSEDIISIERCYSGYRILFNFPDNLSYSVPPREAFIQRPVDDGAAQKFIAMCRTAFPTIIMSMRAQKQRNYLRRFPWLRYKEMS